MWFHYACQKEHETETSVVQKAVSAERNWKGPWPLFFLHSKVKGPLRSVPYDWMLLLSVIVKNVRSSSIYYNGPGCGAILGIGCKVIVLWEDTDGSCVSSSHLREQILHLLIKQEYKWSFLLLMYKLEQIPGCSSVVLEQLSHVATCIHPCALACCLDRNHPFNALEAECPRYLFYQPLAIWWSAKQGLKKGFSCFIDEYMTVNLQN